MPKMKIDEMGYVDEMRQRLGLEEGDTRKDAEIESMSPLSRVRLIAGWFLGYDNWANTFKEYFKSQGLYLTTNPEADGVIEE